MDRSWPGGNAAGHTEKKIALCPRGDRVRFILLPGAAAAAAAMLVSHAGLTRARAEADRRELEEQRVQNSVLLPRWQNVTALPSMRKRREEQGETSLEKLDMQLAWQDRVPDNSRGRGTGSGPPVGVRPGIKPNEYEGVGAGMRRLEYMIATLNLFDRLGWKRSTQQMLFHQVMVGACLEKIMGEDLHRHIGALLERFDMTEIKKAVILYTSRRMGKTISVALFAAAFLWTQPSCEVSVFSPGKRASMKILNTIHRMIMDLINTMPEADQQRVVVTKNDEMLAIRGTGNFASAVNCYPSKVEISPPQPLPRPPPRPLLVIYIVRMPRDHFSKNRTTRLPPGTHGEFARSSGSR